MLTQLFNMPRDKHFWLACSGGVDSMAVASFYRRGNKSFTLLYFNHGTPQAWEMGAFVDAWAKENEVPAVLGFLTKERPKGLSPEEHWRNERYAWLQQISNGDPLITCHHLDDAIEGYVFSCLHGNPKVIAAKRDNIYRPFLINPKSALVDWCVKHDVKWVEDVSNNDVSVPRNRIRHRVLPECLGVNPGLATVVRKKVLAMVGRANQ